MKTPTRRSSLTDADVVVSSSKQSTPEGEKEKDVSIVTPSRSSADGTDETAKGSVLPMPESEAPGWFSWATGSRASQASNVEPANVDEGVPQLPEGLSDEEKAMFLEFFKADQRQKELLKKHAPKKSSLVETIFGGSSPEPSPEKKDDDDKNKDDDKKKDDDKDDEESVR